METNKDDSLYTYDRLSKFVKNYKSHLQNAVQKSDGEDDNTYKYYHFEVSPKGIEKTSVGRLSSAITSKITNWSAFANTNTTDAWLLNLGKTNTRMMHNENQAIKSLSIQPGLILNIMNFDSENYSTNKNTFNTNVINMSRHFDDLPNTSGDNTVVKSGQINDFTSLQNALQLNNSVKLYSKILASKKTVMGCEWRGFFKPSQMGQYRFTINTSNGYCFAWIGNKSVCEYLPYNSDVNNNNYIASFNVSSDNYIPIRIQYYTNITTASIQKTQEFSIKIELVKGNQFITIPTNDCFYTINNGNYIPPILYCAFVSTSPESYAQGKLQCYSLLKSFRDTTISRSDLKELYQTLNEYKYQIHRKEYDLGPSGGIVFGELPNNIYYTPVRDSPTSLPEVFSIYRIESDPRMGHTFQIDTKLNDGLYDMRNINPNTKPSIINYSKSYHEYSGYYPEIQASGEISGSIQQTGEQCKESCNSNDNCNHYYVYSSDGNDQCVIDSKNTTPIYNQIHPTRGKVDKGSSALFLRNYEFTEPTCGKVPGKSDSDTIKIKTVEPTNNYSPSFPYAKYNWTGQDIKKVDDIGICGDANYKKLTNDAASILYKDATYFTNGSWVPGKEGFKSHYTDAIEDTQNAIRRNLQREQKYAKNMEMINGNYNTLTKDMLPEYKKTKEILENNADYDYNGNELSYINNIPPNTIEQQAIEDNNELYAKDNLLYILGSVTAATLVVFTIMIAKE